MEEIVFFRLRKLKSLGRVRLFATPWTLQSMEFSRPGYCVGSRLCVLSYSEGTCFSFNIFSVLTLTDVAYSRNTKSRVEPADWCPAKRFPCRLCVCVLVTLSCPTPCDPTREQPTRLLRPWNSPGKNTGVDCHTLLQRILPTQGSKPSLLHRRQVLYCLSNRVRLTI